MFRYKNWGVSDALERLYLEKFAALYYSPLWRERIVFGFKQLLSELAEQKQRAHAKLLTFSKLSKLKALSDTTLSGKMRLCSVGFPDTQ